MFYGLNANGDGFFEKNGKLTPFNEMISNETINYGELFLVKIKDENTNELKEYPIFFGTNGCGLELYDFKNNKVYTYSSEKIFQNLLKLSTISVINIISNNENYI